MNERHFEQVFGDSSGKELSPLEATSLIAGLCIATCDAARDVMRAIDERDRLIAKHLSYSGANP